MYHKDKENVQRRLSAIASQIIDLCNPVASRLSKGLNNKQSGREGEDLIIDHARFQLHACNIDLNDTMRMIILKLRDTVVVLEMLRNCQLLSKEDVLPIVIECHAVLDCIQNQAEVH